MREEEKLYAMKVLVKSSVWATDQVEHTAAERRILAGIDHPYLASLRFAFQTNKKLYMVMSYYAAGCVMDRLHHSGRFNETRCR